MCAISAVSPLVSLAITLGWQSVLLWLITATTTNTAVGSFPHQIPRSTPHISRKRKRTARCGDIKGSLSAIFLRRWWELHYVASWQKIKCLLFDWAQVKMRMVSSLIPQGGFSPLTKHLRASVPSSVCLSVCRGWWSGLLDCSSSDNQRPQRASVSVCEL